MFTVRGQQLINNVASNPLYLFRLEILNSGSVYFHYQQPEQVYGSDNKNNSFVSLDGLSFEID